VFDDVALFAPDGPLDLTSLDAIEIAIAIEREYKVKMKNISSARDYFQSSPRWPTTSPKRAERRWRSAFRVMARRWAKAGNRGASRDPRFHRHQLSGP
jgi:hypothetical protein